MRTLALIALWSTALLGAVPARTLNTFRLPTAEGAAEIEWLTASSFRFERTWGTGQITRRAPGVKAIPVAVTEQGAEYVFETRYVIVRAAQDASGLVVTTAAGAPVTELHFARESGRAVVTSAAAMKERFYGLGPRGMSRLDLRGQSVRTTTPFLLSSAGYGEFYPGPGEYAFDVAAASPDKVRAILPDEHIRMTVHFGPTPKEVLEEFMTAARPVNPFGAADFEIHQALPAKDEAASWSTLTENLHSLLNLSLSADLIPAFDLTRYASSEPMLFARAAELAAVMPNLRAQAANTLSEVQRSSYRALLDLRERLAPYLLSYTREAQDRGFPVMRPLALDYAEDATARERSEEFQLGDELLVAPALNPTGSVQIYLPRGIWTDFATEQVYKGRQEYAVSAPPGVLPMFARNGTIVPVRPAEGAPLELHYFPLLGAEFFLAEEDDPEVSQFHAAPAGDLIRLETESRVERVYDWVLHHAQECRRVEMGTQPLLRVKQAGELAPGTWHFDVVKKQLRIRVHAAAQGDEIVHVIL